MEGVLFGVHIPRCAGTSLVTGIARQLAPEQMYQAVSLAKNWWSNQFEIDWILNKDSLDFVWGHYLQEEMIRYFRKRVILVTGFRNPLERMSSQVRYVNRLRLLQGLPPVQLEQYVLENANYMCNFLVSRFYLTSTGDTLLERAISVLEKFNYVYFTDDYQSTVMPIYKSLGVEPLILNENGAEEDLHSIEIDETFFKEDILLYEQAESMFRGREPQLESELPSTWLFRQTAPDVERLQDWMFQCRLDEFRSWGILEEVITQRKLMLDAIEAEMAFFAHKDHRS